MDDYAIAGTPGIDYGQFRAILDGAQSPAAEEAVGLWAVLVAAGVRPEVWLAFGRHESGLGKLGIVAKYDTKNMGNVRSPEVPGAGVVIQTERGPFVKYHTWTAGAQDWAARLKGPKYAGAGLTTVRQVIPKYAPSSDDNTPENYIRAVLADIERWVQPQEKPMPKIALAAGHRNTSGGDTFEQQQTAQITPAVAAACRALGMEVRVVQPDDGRGIFPGGLDAVGRQVVKWHTEGWVPDIFLEVHTEGGGGTGCFAIYPDWTDDVDWDVRDKLGPDAARRVALATGLGVRNVSGPGVMSERRTGVGSQGSRLGIFRTTAPIAATTTRLIIEYGAHDKQPDLDIAKSPGFAERCGRATAEAFAAFLGVEVTPPAPAVDHPLVRAWRELFAA